VPWPGLTRRCNAHSLDIIIIIIICAYPSMLKPEGYGVVVIEVLSIPFELSGLRFRLSYVLYMIYSIGLPPKDDVILARH
jgi:hypothetical protein